MTLPHGEAARRQKERTIKWKLDNPDKLAAIQIRADRKWKADGMYKRRTGVVPLRPYPEICDICGKPPPGKRRLAADHCHDTGIFRGWLCIRCNTGLGKFADSTELLKKAADYLGAAERGRTADSSGSNP